MSYLYLQRESVTTAEVWGGSLALIVFVITLEWFQLSIPGRTADVTQALLAVNGLGRPPLYVRGIKWHGV